MGGIRGNSEGARLPRHERWGWGGGHPESQVWTPVVHRTKASDGGGDVSGVGRCSLWAPAEEGRSEGCRAPTPLTWLEGRGQMRRAAYEGEGSRALGEGGSGVLTARGEVRRRREGP